MTSASEPTPSVGWQLKSRREELDLTQGALAGNVQVTVNAISNTERDQSKISRGKRALWERALRLRPGTISRAYDQGTPLEPLDDASSGEDRVPPEVDMNDPRQRAVWETTVLSKEDRLEVIRSYQVGKAQRGDSGSGGRRLA